MKKYFSIILAISLALPLFAEQKTKDSEIVDPLQHVRITYNKFNTPDAAIFDMLLDMIRTYTETRTEAQLETWVFSQMNATWDQEADAWVTSQVETPRHSREDISELVDLLLDVANNSFQTSVTSQRKLFCPKGKPLGMEQKLAALEQRNIDKKVDEEFYLNATMESIGDIASADLRAWLSRIKSGYKAREYNYRTLWEGREDELDTQFSHLCKTLGDSK